MYNFIDVTEASEGFVLPSEAMMINGQYIENLINGYRTLNVSGREALSPDVGEIEVGIRDGSALEKKRYPSRIIVVTYQLIADSNEAFRDAYNQLAKILDVKDAELIFNDERDKFFTGTPCIIDAVTPGLNSVVGKFEILCTDPFKYSVIEYEATTSMDDASILIDYNGTYKARPQLEATFFNEEEVGADGETAGALTGAGDCGYVAFFDEDENIIQLGDPDEIDGDNPYPKSQTQMNQTFLSETAWGTTAKALWAMNSGVVPAEVQQMGTVAMGAASYGYSNVSGETSQTLASSLVSTVGNPFVYYTVSAKTSSRKANSVFVNVVVTGSIKSGYLAPGTSVSVGVTVAGVQKFATLKSSDVIWNYGAKSVSIGFTITGLSASQTSLANCSVQAAAYGTGSGSLKVTALPNIRISDYETNVYTASHFLFPNSHGDASGWHGPSITRTFGADESGEVGAANFTLTYQQKMCIGDTSAGPNQLGGFHCHLSDANGKVVAGVRVSKNQTGSRAASLMLFVNNVKVHQVGIDLAYNNKFFGANPNAVQTSTITKSGSKIVFSIGGYAYTHNDNAVKDMKVTKCTFMFERYGTSPILTYNGLYTAKFVKNNCNTYRDIPNKFSANDVVVADCKNAEIYLNGTKRPDLGALGNNWEAFCLTPGLNQIGVAHSEWVDAAHAPTFKVKYREVFL